MSDTVMQKAFDAEFSATALGDGHWGIERGHKFNFTHFVVTLNNWDDEGFRWGHVKAFHDVNRKEGLPYTDSAIESAVRAQILNIDELDNILETRMGGSEQGMQGTNFLDFDVDVKVKENITVDTLKALGFNQV